MNIEIISTMINFIPSLVNWKEMLFNSFSKDKSDVFPDKKRKVIKIYIININAKESIW